MSADTTSAAAALPIRQRLRWHWLWFLPLCLLVLVLIERHTIHLTFHILKLGYQRWDWGALISPSAAFCLSVLSASVDLPLRGLWAISLIIIRSADELRVRQRWLYSVLIVIGILALPFVTDTLVWGSFPFVIDDQGVYRMRMLPFIPWPYGRYMEL